METSRFEKIIKMFVFPRKSVRSSITQGTFNCIEKALVFTTPTRFPGFLFNSWGWEIPLEKQVSEHQKGVGYSLVGEPEVGMGEPVEYL